MPRWYFNLFFVFLVSGLWHGANWTYVIWGALNGFYLVFAIVTEKLRKKLSEWLHLDKVPKLNNLLQILITFVLACIAWVFFRADSLESSLMILDKIFRFNGSLFIGAPAFMVYSLLGIVFLVIAEFKQEYFDDRLSFFHHPNWLVRKLSYTFIMFLILTIGVFDGGQFIYFQF